MHFRHQSKRANRLNRDILVGRLDHQFTPSDLLTARYYINNSDTYNSGTYGLPEADPLGDITDVRVQSILGAYTHIFSPSLSNDVRFTYLRRKFIDSRPGAGQDLAAKIGLKGVTDAAFPAFTIPGYATLGNPAAVARFQTPILDRQILNALSWYKGRHAWKFGVEIRAGANDEIRDRGSAGNFTLSPLITRLPGVAGTGNALASFLLGEVNAASIQISDKIKELGAGAPDAAAPAAAPTAPAADGTAAPPAAVPPGGDAAAPAAAAPPADDTGPKGPGWVIQVRGYHKNLRCLRPPFP